MSCGLFHSYILDEPGQPGAWNFLGWPGKITPSPEAQKYFSKPGIIQIQVKFLDFTVIFTILSEIWLNEGQNLDQILICFVRSCKILA